MSAYDFNGKLMSTPGWGGTVVNGRAGLLTLTGTSGADLINPLGASVMAGLGGNDNYQYVTMATKVVEAAGGGIDTVFVNGSYIMPDNVENLTVWWADSVFGNDLGNVMIGNTAGQTIDGGAGNDWLKGGGGHDVFRFSAGSDKDVVADFVTHSAATVATDSDLVRLAGYAQFTSFAQVSQAMTQSGSDVVLQLDGQDAVKFLNHKVGDFTAADFQLGLDKSNLVLTFADEFDSLSLWNGIKGTGSQGTWRTDYGWGATRDSLASRQLSSEGQVFVDPLFKGAGSTALGLNPFSIDNGELTITATPTPAELASQVYNQPYVSGLLTSRESFSQTYGYFEAKIDIPVGSGTWPAFWLVPTDGSWPPELDVMENFGGAATYYTSHAGTRAAPVTNSNMQWDPAVSEGSHVWGLMWTAETVTWYLDGVAIYSIDTPPEANKPMYLVLDLAMQKGAPLGQTASMVVDWVHAYQIGDAGAPPPPVPAPDPAPAPVPVPGPVPDPSLDLTGTAGADKLIGGNGDDHLMGLDGNDWLDGGAGADTMTGGNGNDTYVVDNAGDVVIEAAGGGTDSVQATIDYTLGANIEKLTFIGSGNWTGTGNALGNGIFGGAGNDTIYGLGGSDWLEGGSGDDVLVGGAGSDVLVGGSGADRFVFNAVSESPLGSKDTIKDFQAAQGDKIDLSAIDAASLVGGNDPFAWIGSAAFSHVAGELRFQAGTGGVTVQGDVNGDGTPDFAIWLAGVSSLSATDFVL